MSDNNGLRRSSRDGYGSLRNNDDIRASNPLVQKLTHAAANIQSRDTFLCRLFPSPTQKAAAEGELALVKSEYEFRREALEIARRTQVDSLKEACNQYLIGQKAEARQQIASFLLEKTADLQESLDRTFKNFATAMDQKMAEAELIERKSIRDIRVRQLERDLEEFGYLQADLADRFRRIVSEGI